MKLKNLVVTGVLAAALAAQPVFALEATPYMPEDMDTSLIMPVTGLENGIMPYEEAEPEYAQIKGVVTEIRAYYDLDGEAVEGSYYVQIEDENGNPVNFFVAQDTISLTGETPVEGDTFAGVYDANLPVIMIYPPRYTAAAFAVNLDCETLFVPDTGKLTVYVEGNAIEAPAPFINTGSDYPALMVPVRAIAEELGYEVFWEEETRTVRLNNAISFAIGEDGYNLGRMAPIALGNAPQIVNNRTYVPLNFFREVIKMNNAYMLEGVVEINNDEKME